MAKSAIDTHMSIGCSSLQLNGNCRKQQNLDSSSAGIPEWTRNTISIRNSGGLEESSRPCPRRHNRRCDKTRLHSSSSRAEHFGGLEFMVVPFEDPRNEDLILSAIVCAVLVEKKLTMPNANTAPSPRTIPYPQPTLRGGAIAISVVSR